MVKSLLKNLFTSIVTKTIAPIKSSLANRQKIQPYLPPSFTDSDRLAKIQAVFPEIDAMYKDYAEKNHFPGYAYGIMLDGKLVYSGSGGFIDLDKKIPASPQSMFRIASMTKSFTALAILKLRDEGKLKLDDPVYHYIPEIQKQQLTEDAPVITIRDLLIHSAGFPSDDPWADRKLSKTDKDLITLLEKGIFFSNVPGTAYEYSNLDYTLLGYIIKKITGTSYGKFIAEKIWQPIGMEGAFWDFKEVPAPQLAHGYRWIDENWKEEELLPDGIFGAMGGMITSIESFSRYASLHQLAWPPRDDAETGPIKRSSIREMHQPWRIKELVSDFKHPDGCECPLTSGYGYGLNWSRDHLGRVFVGHSGGLPGFGSNWCIMPEYGLGAILFANVTYAAAAKVNPNVLDKLIVTAQLKPRQLPLSKVLRDRQTALVTLLPDWKNAATSEIFAENFFLDYSIESLKKETKNFFAKAGKIISVGDVIPESQLRGYFIMKGEKTDLHVSFALTPENPPVIQQYQIKEVESFAILSNMTKEARLIPELKVIDFKKSLDFYTRLAKFEVLYDRPENDFAMLEINGARLMIEGLADKSRSWLVGQMERPFGRGLHLQIEVQNVESLYQNFKKAEYPIFFGMEEKWYRVKDKETGHKQFLVQDPDGYLLRFFENIGIRPYSQ